MPSYQEALELALKNKYKSSLEKLESVLDEITAEHSTNTAYHIFVLFKIASINNLSGKVFDNEEVYQRINEIAMMAYHDENRMLYK